MEKCMRDRCVCAPHKRCAGEERGSNATAASPTASQFPSENRPSLELFAETRKGPKSAREDLTSTCVCLVRWNCCRRSRPRSSEFRANKSASVARHVRFLRAISPRTNVSKRRGCDQANGGTVANCHAPSAPWCAHESMLNGGLVLVEKFKNASLALLSWSHPQSFRSSTFRAHSA